MAQIGMYLGTSSDDVSNINNVLSTWVDVLNESGHKVDLIGGMNIPETLSDQYGNHEVKDFNPSTPFGKIRAVYNHVSEYIEESHPDVVVQIWRTPTHAPGLSLAGDRNGTETIVRISGDVFSAYRGYNFPQNLGKLTLNNVLGRIPLRLASEIVVLGPNLKSSVVERGTDEEHVNLLPPPSPDENQFEEADDKTSIRTELGLDPDRPIALFVGRLSELKGMQFMESVMESVLRKSDYQFVLVGDGVFQGRFDKKFDSDDVVMPGFVSHEEVQKYYKAGTVYVHPSPFEGIPLVILEAFQSGLPVIAREAGDVEFILNDVVQTEDQMVRQLLEQDWNETWQNEEYFSNEFQQNQIQKIIEKVVD